MDTTKTVIRLVYNGQDQRREFLLDLFGFWESGFYNRPSTEVTKGHVNKRFFKRLLTQLQELKPNECALGSVGREAGFWIFQLYVEGVLIQSKTGPVMLKPQHCHCELDRQLRNIQKDLCIFTSFH